MNIEVIADTLSDARIAQEAGAGRIELVTGLAEGGLTPSYGVIESVCKHLRIPVNVMIRPHSRSFCYSEEEMEMMIKDIHVCKKLGAAGVVFGALRSDNQIHTDQLNHLIDAAENLDITFHRAFDEVSDQIAALEIIKQYPQISRILTSGGQPSAVNAADRLKLLNEKTEDSHLKIMAGAGLSIENIKGFLEKVPVNEIHFGTGVRHQSSYAHAIDPERIEKIKKAVFSK